MKAKIFEVRDRGTFIPVLAVQLGSQYDQEQWLQWSAGYGTTYNDQSKHVMLTTLKDGKNVATTDPYDWNDRTIQSAHVHIIMSFNSLAHGEVLDVEFLLQESPKPKRSQRFDK